MERKFLSDWKFAVLFSALIWMVTFLEAGVMLNFIQDLTLWNHNYFIFAVIATFAFAFVYFWKTETSNWIEEAGAFAIVLVLVNLILDYAVLFFLLESPIFNLQNLFLYVAQFLACLLASFVYKKKKATDFTI